MNPKRPTRRLLACAALSAGVLLGQGAASAETPKPARSPLAALLDAALRMTAPPRTAQVELQPVRRMGNSKGPGYTDRCALEQVRRARPVAPAQARRGAPTPVRAPK